VLAARLEPGRWADQQVVISTPDVTATYTSKAAEAGSNTTTEVGRTSMRPPRPLDSVRKNCNSKEEVTARDPGQTQVRCKI
jgi:hypothetical protein